MCENLKFTHFEDVVSLNALYRPGAMRSGLATHYINRKRGKEKVKKIHPVYDEITKATLGILVYQEQLIQCFVKLAGYKASTGDELRKKMAKSYGVETMGREKEHFVDGAVENGMSKKEALKLFENMAFFGSYAFNKAHSVAYSMISYWGMYLKTYYPVEFYYSLMKYETDNEDIIGFIKEARESFGIEIRNPDVTYSDVEF